MDKEVKSKFSRVLIGGVLGSLIGLIVGYLLFGNYMGFQFSVKTLIWGISVDGDGMITKIFNTVARGVVNEFILNQIRIKILLSGLFSGIVGLIIGFISYKKSESLIS